MATAVKVKPKSASGRVAPAKSKSASGRASTSKAKCASTAKRAKGSSDARCSEGVCADVDDDRQLEEDKAQGKKNQELGRKGEEAAARFLYRRGYEIVARNWTCYAGEADIIAEDNGTLVFVEVKTRRDCRKGFPSEAVSAAKRDRYERIALAYLSESNMSDMRVRFDVVSIVVVGRDRAFIRHQINAFSGSKA